MEIGETIREFTIEPIPEEIPAPPEEAPSPTPEKERDEELVPA